MKKQFQEDFNKWKNQRQGEIFDGGPRILSGAEMGHVLTSNRQQKRREATHISQTSTSAPYQSPNAHKSEFLNPNHFQSIADSVRNIRFHPKLVKSKTSATSETLNRNTPVHEDDADPLVPVAPAEPVAKPFDFPDTEDDPYMSYVQAVELDVGGQYIDSFKIVQTFDSCHEAYIRFLSVNGHFNSMHTNSVSYDDFNNNGCAIWAFDLTSNSEGGVDPFSVPAARTGKCNSCV